MASDIPNARRTRLRCQHRGLPQGLSHEPTQKHPGQLLKAELEARDLSANQLALGLRVPSNRVTAILRGERSVSAETAIRLGLYFGTGAAIWMNLQAAYDLSVVELERGSEIEREVLPVSA